MRVISLTHSDFPNSCHLIAGMHRLRYRVFRDRLNWDVSVSGQMEIDGYDALKPTYIVAVEESSRVVGCARLLPSTGPTMLGKTFPALLGSTPCPQDRRIFESSRFASTPAPREVRPPPEFGTRRCASLPGSSNGDWQTIRRLSSPSRMSDLSGFSGGQVGRWIASRRRCRSAVPRL